MLRFLQLGAHPPRRSPHPDPLPRGEREKGGAVGKTLSLDGRGCGPRERVRVGNVVAGTVAPATPLTPTLYPEG
jgi:hypothetical protein